MVQRGIMKYIFIVFIFSITISTTFGAGEIDSLKTELQNTSQDSSKVLILIRLGWISKYSSPSEAKQYSTEALKIAKRMNSEKLVGKIYNNLGVIKSIEGDYKKAIEYYLGALKIFSDLNQEINIASLNNNIGVLYYYEDNYTKAIEHYKNAYKIRVKTNDKNGLQISCANLGDSYRMLNKLDSAMKYLDYGLILNNNLDDKDTKAILLLNKGIVLSLLGKKEIALSHVEEAYRIDKSMNQIEGMIIDLINMALIHIDFKNYFKAEKYLKESEVYALKLGYKDHLAEVYKASIDLYGNQSKYKEAYEYEKLYISIHDSLVNENMVSAVADAEEKYNKVTHELEIENLKKSNVLHRLEIEDIKHHRTMNYVFVVAVFVLMIMLFLIYKSNKQRKESNQILEIKNNEIEKQKTLVDVKNKDVMDSIRYAKKIQFSILPETKVFEKYFSDYFVFYKPKDIVSGDFYWAQEIDGKLFFAVVDCTGHGVPGAFMSIIAYDGLNKIVTENKNLHPGQILDRLHHHVKEMQRAEEGGFKEGMDLSLCCYNPKNKILEFAGAYNSAILNLNGELIELDANRVSIASSTQNKKDFYRNYMIKLTSRIRPWNAMMLISNDIMRYAEKKRYLGEQSLY